MPKDTIEIRIPNFKKIKNPWAISTLILGIIAVTAIVLLAVTYFQNHPLGYCTTSETASPQQVGQSVVNFLNSNTNATVQLQNVTGFSGMYKVNILYNDQAISVYATSDGKYMVQPVALIQ